jgi:integrase
LSTTATNGLSGAGVRIDPSDGAGGRSLGDWLEEWLGLCVVRGLAPRTLETYRWVIRAYLPEELLETQLRALRPQQLNALYAALLSEGRRRQRSGPHGGGLSPRTVRMVHTILRRALHDAVRLRMVELNPADAADPPSQRMRSPLFPTWSPAELRQFLLATATDQHYAAYHLAAFTGLRRGELLGLRWADIDLENDVLRVVQTVVGLWNGDLYIGPTKTDRSRRVIALDRQTVTVLRRHRRTWERVTSSHVSDNTFVFCDKEGRPINPERFGDRFRSNVRRAGVPHVRFHDLRHMHATHALQAGIHPKIVSERLGHASIGITLEIYSHALPNMQAEAAETIARLCRLSPA